MTQNDLNARTWTHPDVFTVGVAQGWAEAETDPTRIDWPARQARAAIPFEVVNGRPVNPCEKTGITHGRNEMGIWGEQQMADALVTVTLAGTRHLLMIERGDGYGWAVPGGHVEPGEAGLQAAVRELAEETGLTVPPEACREMPPRYVPDPRSSDEAWAVTVPVHIDLGTRDALPPVTGTDDARRAEWIPADSFARLTEALECHHGGRVFAAHVTMVGDFLGEEAADGAKCLTIGELKEALIFVTDLGGAWGHNLSVDKPVLLRVHGHAFRLVGAAASFHEGRFAVMLDGAP